jgi:hypothetical protein
MSRLLKKLDTNLMRFLDWNALYKSLSGIVTIALALRSLFLHIMMIFL